MKRLHHPRRRRPGPLLASLGVLALGWPCVPASAQIAPAGGGQVYGLTEEQKAQVLSSGSEASVDAALPPPPGADRQIHGELGAMIGTGGARGVAGTAAIPLGQDGGAIISFENSRFGNRRYR